MHRTGLGVLPGGRLPRRYWALLGTTLLVLFLASTTPAWAKTKHTPKPNIAGEWVFGTGNESVPDFADILNIGQSISGTLSGTAQIVGGPFGFLTGSISGSSVSVTVPFGGLFRNSDEPSLLVTFSGSLEGENSISGHWTSTEAEYEVTADEEFKVVRVEGPKGTFTAERFSHAEDEEEAKFRQEEREAKEEEEDPTVTSVTDNATGAKQGPLIGGDELTVKGTGFDPEDGNVEVEFESGGQVVGTEDVDPNGETELQVAVPNMASLASSVPEGAEGLPISVRVHFEREDEEGEDLDLTSAANPSAVYEALLPHIAAITDAASNVDVGSIAGGETLTIKGTGFFVAAGGKATVSFIHEGQPLGEPIEVTPSDATEIQMKAPNLSKYASEIPSGHDRLGMDVVVRITGSEGGTEDEEQSRTQRSGEGGPDETGDSYEALSLAVDSVIDETTGTNYGSILGGEQLRIEGSGFEVPAGGTATVTFEQNGEVLGEPVTATSGGTEDLFLTTPDFAKYEPKIPDGTSALELTVRVTLEIDGEKIESERLFGEDEGNDTYLASEPAITSATDEQTGTAQGSILGGDTLKIKGSGFTVPAGGLATISFNLYPDGEVVGTAHETVTGDTELEVTVPDLAKYKDQIPSGQNALKLELRALIEDAEGNVVESFKEAAVFEVLAPKVESVVDESTGTNQGSVLGGSTLTIKGSGLTVPGGGEAEVAFVATHGEALGEDVTATPISATELQITVPDEAKYKDKLEPGKSALAAQVALNIGNAAGEQVESIDHEPADGTDTYEFLFPKIESVVDSSTGKNQGSALGGSTLSIKGTGLTVPAGDEAKVGFIAQGGEPLGEDVAATPVSATELQVTVPDAAAYEDKLEGGKSALPAQVVVAIGKSGSEQVQSIDHEPPDGSDTYEFLFPHIESIVADKTGSDQGPILGAEALRIKGTGLSIPAGDTATATFYHGGDAASVPVDVTGVSATEVEVLAPNMANFASEIPAGKHALETKAILTIADGLTTVGNSGEGEAGNLYEALAPTIDSVSNDTATTTSSGAIAGGEELRISGSGFDLPPEKSSAKVIFESSGVTLEGVDVTPVSATEIALTSPNLLKYASKIASGEDGLATDVAVVLEAEGLGVQSAEGEAGAAYTAELPKVESAIDETTGSGTGSVLGGDIMKVKGAWLGAPAGGSTTVSFRVAEGTTEVAGVDAEAIGSDEVLLETPDLSSEAAKAVDNSVLTDVVATVSDGADHASSNVTEGDGDGDDSFVAAGPAVTAVKNSADGSHTGSINGGETLEVEGTGFVLPRSGIAAVEFLDEEASGQLEEVEVTPVSSTEIELSSPDLSRYDSGAGDLLADLRVEILGGGDASTLSPLSGADQFTFEPLAITSEGSADFKVGQEDEFAVAASGGASVELKESGELPDGVSFEDNGEGAATIAGTPAAGSAGAYDLVLTAKDAAGEEATQDFTLTVQDVPAVPQAVAATAGIDSAKVFWEAPTDDGESEIESYVVTAEPGGESMTVAGDTTSATLEHLEAGKAYTFTVVAKNAIGESEPGESAAVVPTDSQLEDPQSASSSEADGSATTEPVESSSGSTLTASGEGEGTLEAGTYSKDPVVQLTEGTSYFDVQGKPGSSFKSVVFKVCGVAAGAKVDWYDPSTGKWAPASDQSTPSGSPLCITVTVNATTTPSLSDLYGTIFAVVASPSSCSIAPAIETQPRPETVAPAATATFSASASTPAGCGATTVQWYSKAPGQATFGEIAAATSTTYTTPPTTKAQSGTLYEAIFTNDAGATTTKQVAVTVSSKAAKPLKLTPGKLKAATATKAYAVTFSASAGEGPYRFSETGSPPEGLSWNLAGETGGSIELHGTPSRAGTSSITIEAGDSSNPARTVRREYTLIVGLDVAASLGKATATEPYETQLTTMGGTGPYTYMLSGGSLPGGIHLSETGLISGTSPTAGTSSFTITVADSSEPALTATVHAMLTVRLDIEPAKLPAGTTSMPYNNGHGVQLTAEGGSGSYTYTATGLPRGLETTDSGLITGTPTEEGTYNITVEIADAANPAIDASRNYKLNVSSKAKK